MFAAELYWVAFNRTPGIGASKMRGVVSDLWLGSQSLAMPVPCSSPKCPGSISVPCNRSCNYAAPLDLGQLQAQITQHRVKVLTWESPNYPARLLEVPDSPPVLYVRGRAVASR
jgi:DNA processing protein